MKTNIFNIPDWLGGALVALLTSLLVGASMWGGLKSEVSAQVTAQSADASDIKQLISSQAGLQATVNALAKDQVQLHEDLRSFMNTYGGLGNNSPTFGGRGRH